MLHHGSGPAKDIPADGSFRKFCEENLCGKYNANYSCPPACGTVEEVHSRLFAADRALVLQSVYEIGSYENKEAELDAIGDVTRVKGASRYGTSVEIAKRYFTNPNAVVLACAEGFPDGLCGGPLAFAVGATLILTSNESSQLADEYVAGITSCAVTGGTARISDDTVREIFDLPADAAIVKP